ncbi:MAG: OmpA family protein [Myxococcales bacterium]|nr:OmpA family protein [Myxococcales bacterium]
MRLFAWCLLSCSVMLQWGCIWKSDHLKMMKAKDQQISGLEKEKTDLTDQLKSKTDALGSMTEDRNKLKMLSEKLQSQLTQIKLARQQCEERVRALADKGDEKTRKLQQALEQVQKLQDIANRRKALFDRLRASFKSMTDAGKLRVSMVRGMLVVQLEEKILFASGQSSVKREGSEAIAQLTEILKGMNRRWQIAGHTDSVGKPTVNWSLSVQRALAVLRVMLKTGMPPELISAAGFGQYQPTASNDSKEDRARNRRTEIVLVPNLQELQLAQAPAPLQVCLAAR